MSARENHLTREKATRGVSPFLARGDFHARSRFAHSTIPEEKWGTSRSLLWQPWPEWSSDQAPVVQTLDNAIHRLNHYLAGKYLEINCVIHWIGLSISSATGAWPRLLQAWLVLTSVRAVFTWLSKGIGFGFGFTTPFGWLVYLLWFWFYDSQVKTALNTMETYTFW